MRLALAATLFLSAAPALADPLHQYSGLALSADGTRVAAVESDAEPNAPATPHGHVVVRSAATGAILDSLDPCAACTYSGLTAGSSSSLARADRHG